MGQMYLIKKIMMLLKSRNYLFGKSYDLVQTMKQK